MRRFDELFTVPDAGHPDVDTYYEAASSGPKLGALTVPSLVLSATDDPIVRLVSHAAGARGAVRAPLVRWSLGLLAARHASAVVTATRPGVSG